MSKRATTKPAHTELIARGLLLHSGRVLLCQNTAKDYYYLPGGHVEFGEPAARAVEREFLEETGQTVRAGACLLISEHAFTQGKTQRHEVNLVFHVEHIVRTKRSAPPRARAAANSPTRSGVFHVEHPPAFKSLEKGIAFRWLDLAACVDLDIRPAMTRAWLSSGGALGHQPAPPGYPPLAWYSDIPTT